MNLEKYINKRLKTKKVLLMTHCVVGYPSLEDNWKMLEAMQEADIDIVELQMPFSEPMADGPLFVKANQKAIERGITLDQYFDFMQKATKTFSFPILMMGYYNTIFRTGHKQFIDRLKASGGCGVIVPDLPIEEYGDLFEICEKEEISPVMFFTPKSTDARLIECAKKASGFVYCVARKGVTGGQTIVAKELDLLIDRYRNATNIPLALGFGLSKKEDIEFLHNKVQVAILGSALLRMWEENGQNAYKDYLKVLASSR
jgi:tryptophan synthase alpha chain